jgi:hypothetical protein
VLDLFHYRSFLQELFYLHGVLLQKENEMSWNSARKEVFLEEGTA